MVHGSIRRLLLEEDRSLYLDITNNGFVMGIANLITSIINADMVEKGLSNSNITAFTGRFYRT